MPIQVLPPGYSFGSQFGQALGAGAGKGFSETLGTQREEKRLKRLEEEQKKTQETKDLILAEQVEALTGLKGLKGLPSEFLKEIYKANQSKDLESFKQEAKYSAKTKAMREAGLLPEKGEMQPEMGGEEKEFRAPFKEPQPKKKTGKTPTAKSQAALQEGPPHTQQEIDAVAMFDPTIANNWQRQNEDWHRRKEHATAEERKTFESERKYHTDYSKELRKNVEDMRLALPRTEMSLNLARDAVESGDVGAFSWGHIADVTGFDSLRNAKGAQLINAAKENLLSNMNSVSAKAQNIWFEQRMNSMFPKLGQSKEANLTMQEMLEGEAALKKSYINEYDRIAKQDEKEYGFERKDIGSRVDDALKSKRQEILDRTSFRLKEIEENEMGLEKLKEKVGKKVVKGTPLTFAMAKLYHDAFGEKAFDVAKKNGYTVPTLEQFRMYQARPQEFREGL